MSIKLHTSDQELLLDDFREVNGAIMLIYVVYIICIIIFFLDMKFTGKTMELYGLFFDTLTRNGELRLKGAKDTPYSILFSHKFDMHIERLCADDVLKCINWYILIELKLFHSPNRGMKECGDVDSEEGHII
jgi:hypothetical protein